MLNRPFGSEERAFDLKVAQWRDLEKARDCGLGVIARRLAPIVTLKTSGAGGHDMLAAISAGYLGDARLDDVREPILQGLIGGGMTSTDAGALVRKVFDEEAPKGAMFRWSDLAFAIVTEALIGLEDEPGDDDEPGELKAAAKAGRRSQTAKPASETSTGH